MSSNRRRQRSEIRPHPKEEAMSHALATVLHRGRKAASNVASACLACSRETRTEMAVEENEYDGPDCGGNVRYGYRL